MHHFSDYIAATPLGIVPASRAGKRQDSCPRLVNAQNKDSAMTDTNINTGKAKAKPASSFETPKIETPKFEIPKFEIPSMEVPAVFREFAEKGLAQTKENYEKLKAVAEDATDAIEESYANASKGASEYGLKVISNARANSNAAFDLLGSLMGAKS